MIPPKSEIRKDYIQDKYVIIAPRRKKRPHQVKKKTEEFARKICPFCPENVKKAKILDRIGEEKNWKILVIPNKYPAITLDNPHAYGIQEVVIEISNHEKELEDLPLSHIRDILEIYARRTFETSKNKKISYILIFKNSGGPAGASLIHSHSQIFATDFVPSHILDKCQKVQEYKLHRGGCIYCDVIKKEIKSPRLVFKDRYVVAFTPYAPMHNYEIWIMTKRHLDNVSMLNEKEKYSFAKILKRILKKIRILNLPYNYYFHQVVHDEDQHLYMKVVPRGSIWAGVEIGSGVIINPVSPEEAAKFYRKD